MLSNAELEAMLVRLARGEREATVALLIHLGEFDARRLYAPAGFPSLFRYCVDVLHLSEDSAYNRIETARAARRFPQILDMLGSGALNVTTARVLARKLTDENHLDLLASAAGKTKQQVEEMLVGHFPLPDVASSVRQLPAPVVAEAPSVPSRSAPPQMASLPGAPPSHAPARATVRPLAPERYEIRFTAGAETRELLKMSQDLLGGAVPNGNLEEVFRRSLKLLVEDLARKKFAATDSPSESPAQVDGSRHIPAWVKRIVWVRDGGRCAFVAANGRRCEARRALEFHHVDPYAAGGKATPENIQLRCRAHNRHEADLFYGPMREYAGAALAATRSGTSSGGKREAAPVNPGG